MKLVLFLLILGMAVVVVQCAVYIDETVVLGETALLPCIIPGMTHTKIWKSNKLGIIAENKDIRQNGHRFKILQSHSDWSLKIDSVEKSDFDRYICESDSYTTYVTLTQGVPPYFEGNSKRLTKTLSRKTDEVVTLICDAKGLPTPEKKWYRIDEMKQDIFTGFNGETLHLNETESSDESYRCLASNKHGQASITYIVRTLEHSTKMPKTTPQPTKYVILTSKPAARTTGATQSKAVIKSTTRKARSSRVESTSASSGIKSPTIMIMMTFLSLCYLGTTVML